MNTVLKSSVAEASSSYEPARQRIFDMVEHDDVFGKSDEELLPAQLAAAQEYFEERRGQVRVATSEGFAIEFLPQAIADFREKYPGIVFQLLVSAPAEVTRRVREGETDIGVTFSRTTQSEIKVESRQAAPMMAVMRCGHPLARFETLSLSQMSEYPLALPDAGTTIRQLFDIVVGQQRLTLEPAVVSNYVEALHNFAIMSDTISIAAEVTVRYRAARGELVMIPIRDRGMDARHIEVQTLVGRTLPMVVRLFLEFLCGRLG